MRRFSIIVLAMLAVLCTFSAAFCKGELSDGDAFEVYYGKSKSEVRRTAPQFESVSDTMYIVDMLEEDDEYFTLFVIFDDSNYVDTVGVAMTPQSLELMGLENSLNSATALGMSVFGFDGDDMVDAEMGDDGFLIVEMKRGIYIFSNQSDSGLRLYSVYATKL